MSDRVMLTAYEALRFRCCLYLRALKRIDKIGGEVVPSDPASAQERLAEIFSILDVVLDTEATDP